MRLPTTTASAGCPLWKTSKITFSCCCPPRRPPGAAALPDGGCAAPTLYEEFQERIIQIEWNTLLWFCYNMTMTIFTFNFICFYRLSFLKLTFCVCFPNFCSFRPIVLPPTAVVVLPVVVVGGGIGVVVVLVDVVVG